MCRKGFSQVLPVQGLLCLLVLFTSIQTSSADEYSHGHYLQSARKGDTQTALTQLRGLLERTPEDKQLRYDYIVTLQWAGLNEEAISQASHIDSSQAPIFVLEALGKAARDSRQFDLAKQYYRSAIRQDASRLQSTLGLALALADAGETDEALQLLQPRAQREPGNVVLLDALAYVYVRKRDWFGALATYERILKLDAKHRGALSGRIMVTSYMGAPHLALSMAIAENAPLTDSEMDRLLADRAAISVRWGALGSPLREKRNMDTDLAIDLLNKNLDRFRSDAEAKQQYILNAQFDLLVALRDRQRMLEVTALYEQLLEQHVDFPSYALIAAADAYLYQEKPADARELYLQALELEPDNFSTHLSLFYAYLETEQFDEAYKTIDRLNENTVPWQQTGENDRKLIAERTAIAARAYGDLLEEAENRLRPLQARAPHNTELRNLLAYIYMWRGLNHQALDEFNIVLAADPEHLSSRLGRSRALFNLREYQITEQHLHDLGNLYPENKHVMEASRLWGIHNRRELRIDAGSGSSDGVVGASDEQTINTYLYSQPFKYNYRIFLHDYRARAKVVEGNVDYQRVGLGMEYRRPQWKFVAEITRDNWFSGEEGYGARLDWTPDDHWSVGFGYDTQAIDISLRGRYNDITARSGNLDLGYRVSDTRDFGFSVQHYDFSDGNNRKRASARYRERLYTHPHFKTDGIVRLSTSTSSQQDVPYFSPEQDHSIEYTVDNEWLTYRNYDFRFYQRLALTVGHYYQDGFGGNAIWAAQYEHDWNVNDEVQLLYGIRRSRPVYDGTPELTTGYYLTIVWKF